MKYKILTKKEIVTEYFKVLKEWSESDKELLKLIDEKKLVGGAYIAHCRGLNYHVRFFDKLFLLKNIYNNQYKRWDYQYHLDNMKKDLKEAKAYIEKNK